MIERLKSAIVRIWNTNDEIVGVGLLVGQRQILTCAHVIRDALNLQTTPDSCPDQEIKVDFPFPAPKRFIWSQVVIWHPRQDDGSGDIAGLEMQGFPPPISQPITLINKEQVSDLSGHKCRAYGFPQHYDTGVWSFNNIVLDERSGGTIQLTNEQSTGHRIRQGFSGGAIWDEQLNGVIGITTTSDNQADLKVAFMIPTKTLIETWPTLCLGTEQSNTIEIPFVIMAMTKSQAHEIIDETIFSDPTVAPIARTLFVGHKDLLTHDGINELQGFYGTTPEEWKPHRFSETTIENIVWQMMNHHNEDHRHKEAPIVLPKFITQDFCSESDVTYQKAKSYLEKQGGVIIIDSISLHHPKIYRRLSGSGLFNREEVALLVLSPISQGAHESNNLLEQVIRLNMNYAFDRFEQDCDLLCEIGVSDIRTFKRWFINMLHKITAEEKRMLGINKQKFQDVSPYEPRNIHKAWME